MSHEIRTPIGAIKGFVRLMKSPKVKASDIANYTSVIERNTDQLLLLVDDILDLAKVESGKMTVEPTDFGLIELISDVGSVMNFRAREKGIGFELNIDGNVPEQVTSDPGRIRQVLSNIVGNAIKFTETGRVTLTVSYEDSLLRFNIKDTGMGIPGDRMPSLFKPFSQVDYSATRRFRGTGLGLILSRQLCRMFGGDLKLLNSKVGVGSEFQATLRILVPTDVRMVTAHETQLVTENISASEIGMQLRGIKILVVEDSPDNQELMQVLLQEAGANVEIASDGIEGVDKALNNEYDAILMDIQMPRMDGHEASKILRGRGYQPPVVALTAHAMKEERDRCLKSGFSDFLTKPIQQDLIVSTLAKAIEARAARKLTEATHLQLH